MGALRCLFVRFVCDRDEDGRNISGRCCKTLRGGGSKGEARKILEGGPQLGEEDDTSKGRSTGTPRRCDSTPQAR